jgi:hypothetical protein
MQPQTVRELKALCEQEIAKGNGDKKIYISVDDEGNGFHPLFFPFTHITEDNRFDFPVYNGAKLDPTKHIILG